MNGRIDFLNWTMKPDQMHLMNPLFILILIPLFNIAVYPIFYKIGINSPLQKITIGGIFAALSFVCAAAVQYTIIINTHDASIFVCVFEVYISFYMFIKSL